MDFVIESAEHHSYILNYRLLGGDPVPYFGVRTGLEDTLLPHPLCASQESEGAIWNPDKLKDIDLPMTVICAFQSHSIASVIERLHAEGAVKKEKLGLSIFPISFFKWWPNAMINYNPLS